jgi:hypothetical protein
VFALYGWCMYHCVFFVIIACFRMAARDEINGCVFREQNSETTARRHCGRAQHTVLGPRNRYLAVHSSASNMTGTTRASSMSRLRPRAMICRSLSSKRALVLFRCKPLFDKKATQRLASYRDALRMDGAQHFIWHIAGC